MKISPSLMCMDLTQFHSQLKFLDAHAHSYHVDIMDGHYVDNITLSPWFVEQVKKISHLPVEVHLMVEHPTKILNQLLELHVEMIQFHADTITRDAFRIAEILENKNCKFSVVLNPSESVEMIKPYIFKLDKVVVMSVDPGFAGQSFIPHSLDKVDDLINLRQEKKLHFEIEIDGSVNERNISTISKYPFDSLIVGSSGLFNLDDDIEKSWQKMVAYMAKENIVIE
ncbi:D-allulose 6-phosphate 3-epimerase [Allofustis seminis]|uniref:D-allulose 6-phosphate 3-epimerase n=1 Tax=Allofustis seminis TaxID=166939 RepID=UPI00035CD940|nr:D-allulose 6-phosphate 3-epimerase [Allofustis seminis]